MMTLTSDGHHDEQPLSKEPTMTATRALHPDVRAFHEMRRSFRLDVPEYYNFATDALAGLAADLTRPAMLHLDAEGRERWITFAEFAQRSDRLAAALLQRGIGREDRVLVVLPKVPEWNVAVLALMKLGAIAVPCTPMLTAADLEFRLHASGARAVICDLEVAARIDEVAARCPALDVPVVVGGSRAGWVEYAAALHDAPADFAPVRTRASDPCLIYFTSGTTSAPKMVLHSHDYAFGHVATSRFIGETQPDDLGWAPFDGGWAATAYMVFGCWMAGLPLFTADHHGAMPPDRYLEILEQFPISMLSAVPTLFRILLQQDLARFRPRALRMTTGGGEPFNPEIIERWREYTGITILEVYGQTETVILLGQYAPLPVRPGSLGMPSPGHEVTVVDDAGVELPPGEEGHIAVRITPTRPVGLFRGYYGDPERTAQVFAGDWYDTGDRATRDDDGYFWFAGRDDDIIKSSGYRISPFEVESVLLEHPAVAESAVVGIPDDVRGQMVKAYVILAKGQQPSEALAEEIQQFTRGKTATFKCPREVEFVAELPKTISGKIRRVELREREQARRQPLT
jgi:acetyl-CoA synthetase/medium-chain acyl-CoA synthetase